MKGHAYRCHSLNILRSTSAALTITMYYAQMYCYGQDNDHVGITGIVGCLGALFAAPHRLYAAHIPPAGNPVRDLLGAIHFCRMILIGEGAGPAGSLHLFVNGRNRVQVDSEARNMRNALGGPETLVYRMMTNLGNGSGGMGADAATIKVERNGQDIDIEYKHVPDNDWEDGGNAKTGCYHPPMDGTFGGAVVPTNAQLNAVWFPMDHTTCSIRRIH